MSTFENIAKLVRNYRIAAKPKLSQEELARHLGYSNSGQFISNVERGICNIPPAKIDVLAKKLKVPADHVIIAMTEDYKTKLEGALWLTR